MVCRAAAIVLIGILGGVLGGIASLAVTAGHASAETGTSLPGADPHVVDGPGETSVIVDVDLNLDRIVVHPCVDRACTSWATIELDADLSGVFATDWHVRSHDGRVFVVIPGKRLIACTQAMCAGGTTNTLLFGGEIRGLDRIRVDSAGLLAARASVFSDGLVEPQAFHCLDAACTSHEVNPLPAGNVEFINDEFLVTRLLEATSSIETIRCIDRCASTVVTTALLPASVFNGRSRGLQSFETPTTPQRQVHISTRFVDDQSISTLIDCVTPECTNPTVTTLMRRIESGVGIEVNDLGHLVYGVEGAFGGLRSDNRVVTCLDAACSETAVGPPLPRLRRLEVDAFGRPSVMAGLWFITCDSRTCGPVERKPIMRGGCSGKIDLYGVGQGQWTLRSGGSESVNLAYPDGERVTRITGRNKNAPVAAIAVQNGAEVTSAVFNFACDGPADHDASWTCQNDRGRIDVRVASIEVPRAFDVIIGELPPQRIRIEADTFIDEIRAFGPDQDLHPDHGSIITTATDRLDGQTTAQIVDVATGVTVFSRTFTVNCGFQSVAGPEVTIVPSCLGGGGRVDTNIVTTTTGPSNYLVLLYTGQGDERARRPQLARQRTVAEGDWWRLPMTGRDDGSYTMVIKKDGLVHSSKLVTIACAPGAESNDTPEVQVVNACRDGRGYVLFLFVNASPIDKSWVLEFDGVPNRSTSATPWAQSVKAVTGRANGTYTATINGTTQVDVVVQCG